MQLVKSSYCNLINLLNYNMRILQVAFLLLFNHLLLCLVQLQQIRTTTGALDCFIQIAMWYEAV